MINAPCKDCENRHVGCHSTCEAYIEAKRQHNITKEQEDKRRRLENLLNKPYRVRYKSKY